MTERPSVPMLDMKVSMLWESWEEILERKRGERRAKSGETERQT